MAYGFSLMKVKINFLKKHDMSFNLKNLPCLIHAFKNKPGPSPNLQLNFTQESMTYICNGHPAVVAWR